MRVIEQNKAALRTAVDRFNAGDEAYFDFYTDDITLTPMTSPCTACQARPCSTGTG
jgi:hypothetical protein